MANKGTRNNRIIVVFFIILITTIFFLAIRNDFHFNEDKECKAYKIAKNDSLEYERMNCISSMLKIIIIQLDSISRIQKENNEIEIHHNKSVEKSLNQIEKTERHIFKSIR